MLSHSISSSRSSAATRAQTRVAPAVVALPEAVRLAIAGGQVGPGDAGLGELAYGVEEETVVIGHAAMLARLSRQQACDARPMLVADIMTAEHGKTHESRLASNRIFTSYSQHGLANPNCTNTRNTKGPSNWLHVNSRMANDLKNEKAKTLSTWCGITAH